MRPQTPATISSQDQLNKSVNQVLSGNVSPGNGLTFDTSGQPLTYSTDNTVGLIIRVGSAANPNALPNFWAGNCYAHSTDRGLGDLFHYQMTLKAIRP